MNTPLVISNLVPLEFCKFFTHVLLRKSEVKVVKVIDPQVPNGLAYMNHDIMFETLQEYLWPTIEQVVGEELLPTYAYARLYSNGDVLEKHIDRPACEISVTIQLARTKDYIWPIYMDGKQILLNEGDAVVYNGCNTPHWRNVCAGPENYYSGQVFLHFVRKNGEHADQSGDRYYRITPIYTKNRIY